MTITLGVTPRDESTALEVLRAKGEVPAVVYGPKQEPVNVTLDGKVFDKVRKEAGESTIIELTGLASSIDVLIKEIDFNPVKQQVMHVDFYAVEAGKEMSAHVPLHFIGEAPVETNKLGMVNKVLHEVEVTCQPTDLPNHIDVNVETLVTVDDKILVSDLVIPKGVTLELDADETVAVISVAKEEVEEEVETPDMSAIEVEKKGKAEVEEAE